MFPEYSREKIRINPNILTWNIFDFITIIVLFLLIFGINKVAQNNTYPYRTWVITIFIIFLIFLKAEEQLQTNVKLTNKKIKMTDVENYVNTGDILIFRSYSTTGISEFFLFLVISALFSEIFSTHVGLIYKDNTGVYVAESVGFGANIYSILTGTHKDGVVLNDAIKRFSNPYQRILIYKTNIHKYIDNTKFLENISRYKNHGFFENDIYCCNFAQDVLYRAGIAKSEEEAHMLIPFDFIKKENYQIDIEIAQPVVIDNGNDNI